MGWTYGWDGRDKEYVQNLVRKHTTLIRVLMKRDVRWMDGVGINDVNLQVLPPGYKNN
jgi:hypothetical protein